ncbi:hypothetical protein JOB18_017186 [Solea senegalensis]|uniref:Uncharacterized protein n=1 Tax=Solea senegalensis TaxID=28829 RepID=A0AAV6SZ32_SOLSE|nr:hypothetical protein JOB18_017186 [Solea senegalensis]
MANKIAETTQSLSTAAEMRETTKLLMQPKVNWEEYLTLAPLSIAILGELVFISSNDDFSINKNPPAGGFKHIKYPDSFRACLMQICNSGWEAFNDAHNGMDRIRLHTGKIPNYIKTTVYILFNASDKVIETLLPDQLENICSIADDCVEQATMVEKRYSDVFSLIERVGDACADENCDAISQINASCTSVEILNLAMGFYEYVSESDIDWKKLYDEKSKSTNTACNKELCTPALAAKGPMKYKSEKTSSANQRKLAGQVAVENARFQIEQTRAELKNTRESYGKAVENIEKKKQELNAILIELQSCEIKEISFDQTIKMLVKGLDAMERVQEQWKKMVRFFQMISNIIQISLNKTLKNFVKTSDSVMKLDYNEKLHSKDLLYMQAFQASNVASLVHMISSTYTEVSNEYLMDRVSSLGKLMAMDKEKPEFLSERQKLQSSYRAAQEGILRRVLKNKSEFETNARMAKIENGLKAVLPEASAEETRRIKENVQEGYGEETQNYC